MNDELNGKLIKTIHWPDSGNELGRHLTTNETTQLELSVSYHGDRDEFWVIEYRNIDGELKEVARHNPRYAESIVWE